MEGISNVTFTGTHGDGSILQFLAGGSGTFVKLEECYCQHGEPVSVKLLKLESSLKRTAKSTDGFNINLKVKCPDFTNLWNSC